MAATNRYTGTNCTIVFGSTTISNDYTEISMDFSVKTESRVAGNDTDESFNVLYKKGKGSIKFFDTATAGVVITLAMLPGATGNLYIYPKGITSGQPTIAFPIIIESMKIPLTFDKNVILDCSFMKNGAFIATPGTTQP